MRLHCTALPGDCTDFTVLCRARVPRRWNEVPLPAVYWIYRGKGTAERPLSGTPLSDENFQRFLVDRIKSSGLPGSKLCFEITETAAVTNLSAAIRLIRELKTLGCRFALDDFGSGMSSFGYLKKLPVDYLKIDGSFVKDILVDPVDRAMVTAICDIGHVIGIQTIAEFVENDAIRDVLEEIGVDYVQGYGIARPGLLPAVHDER